jgi:hypothetical protein
MIAWALAHWELIALDLFVGVFVLWLGAIIVEWVFKHPAVCVLPVCVGAYWLAPHIWAVVHTVVAIGHDGVAAAWHWLGSLWVVRHWGIVLSVLLGVLALLWLWASSEDILLELEMWWLDLTLRLDLDPRPYIFRFLAGVLSIAVFPLRSPTAFCLTVGATAFAFMALFGFGHWLIALTIAGGVVSLNVAMVYRWGLALRREAERKQAEHEEQARADSHARSHDRPPKAKSNSNIEKLRDRLAAIDALIARPGTAGEQKAARAARERLLRRIAEMEAAAA